MPVAFFQAHHPPCLTLTHMAHPYTHASRCSPTPPSTTTAWFTHTHMTHPYTHASQVLADATQHDYRLVQPAHAVLATRAPTAGPPPHTLGSPILAARAPSGWPQGPQGPRGGVVSPFGGHVLFLPGSGGEGGAGRDGKGRERPGGAARSSGGGSRAGMDGESSSDGVDLHLQGQGQGQGQAPEQAQAQAQERAPWDYVDVQLCLSRELRHRVALVQVHTPFLDRCLDRFLTFLGPCSLAVVRPFFRPLILDTSVCNFYLLTLSLLLTFAPFS